MTEEKKAPEEEKKEEVKQEAKTEEQKPEPKKEEAKKPEPVKEEAPKKEEPKKEEKKPEVKKEVKVPTKFKDLVKQIESLSVLELSELVKLLEEKFGVSAAAPMAAAPIVGTASDQAAEEKTAFNVELTSAGGTKIQVIKVVKEITGKGLKEAKDLVDAAPKVIKENVAKNEAEEIKKKLEEAGATVELK